MEGLDILDYTGEGYKKVMSFGAWRVAYLNYAPRFDRDYFTKLERHNLTDEVFVLVNGSASLFIGEKMEKVPMEPLKIYNVRAGTYHAIDVSRDARVLVVENEDTSPDNTDFIYFEPLKKSE